MSEFVHTIRFDPAYDKRSADPAKNYGICAVRISFYCRKPGKQGVVQFVMSTGWYPPTVTSLTTREPNGWDLGYHSPRPRYEGQTKMPCDLLKRGHCYYDGSGLNAEPVLERLVAEGTKGVEAALEEYYRYVFEEVAA